MWSIALESSATRREGRRIAEASSGNEAFQDRDPSGSRGISGQNLQGQRPWEAKTVGELGPLQPRISRQVPGRARVNR